AEAESRHGAARLCRSVANAGSGGKGGCEEGGSRAGGGSRGDGGRRLEEEVFEEVLKLWSAVAKRSATSLWYRGVPVIPHLWTSDSNTKAPSRFALPAHSIKKAR